MKRRANPAEPKVSRGSSLSPGLSSSNCVWEGQPGTPEHCADGERSPGAGLKRGCCWGCLEHLGCEGTTGHPGGNSLVLLGSSWEEGFVGWGTGLIHSFHKHLWHPLCRALCAYGV